MNTERNSDEKGSKRVGSVRGRLTNKSDEIALHQEKEYKPDKPEFGKHDSVLAVDVPHEREARKELVASFWPGEQEVAWSGSEDGLFQPNFEECLLLFDTFINRLRIHGASHLFAFQS